MKRVKYHRNVSPIMMFRISSLSLRFISLLALFQFFFILFDIFVCKFPNFFFVCVKCLTRICFLLWFKITIYYVKRSLAGNRYVLAEIKLFFFSLLLLL